MTEEEAKALAQQAINNARTTYSEQGKAAASRRDLSSGMSPEDLAALGVKTAVTSQEQSSKSMLESVGSSIADAAKATFGSVPSVGDLEPNLDFGAMRYLDPLGVNNMLKNRAERTGETPFVDTALNSIMDVMSFGSKDRILAGAEAIDKTGIPTSQEDLEDLLGQYTTELEANQLRDRDLREANPGVAFGTDMVASVATGKFLANRALGGVTKYAPNVAKRIGSSWVGQALFSSGVGASEVGVYRLNKSGDLEQAAVDASLAMVGGMVISGALRGGGTVAQKVSQKFGYMNADYIDESVGREVLDAINIDRVKAGLPPATVDDVAKEIDKLGPDASLMDAFPELRKLAKFALDNESPEASATNLRNVLATRNNIMSEIVDPESGLVRTVLGGRARRTPQAYELGTKQIFEELSPQYEAIFDSSDMRFSVDELTEGVSKVMGKYEGLSQQERALRNATIKMINELGKTGDNKISLRQLSSIKKTLDEAIGAKELRVEKAKTGVPIVKNTLVKTHDINAFIRSKLDTASPELAALNAKYGSAANAKSAYAAGRALMRSADVNGDDVIAFMGNRKPDATSIRGFIEGAQHELFKKLQSAKTSDDVRRIITENRPALDRLEGFIGKEHVDTLIENLNPELIKAKTFEILSEASPNVKPLAAEGGGIASGVLDLLTAVGAAPGATSKAAGLGAGRRLMSDAIGQRAVPQQVQAYDAILSRLGPDARKAFEASKAITERPIRPTDARSIARGAGATGALGVLFGNAQSPQ